MFDEDREPFELPPLPTSANDVTGLDEEAVLRRFTTARALSQGPYVFEEEIERLVVRWFGYLVTEIREDQELEISSSLKRYLIDISQNFIATQIFNTKTLQQLERLADEAAEHYLTAGGPSVSADEAITFPAQPPGLAGRLIWLRCRDERTMAILLILLHAIG